MSDLVTYLTRLGDNTLVLGHRLSEWCGRGPALEEDIALANTALDLIGQTQMWLGYAAEAEAKGRTADDLAMGRDVWDFRNLLLLEQPNGDFGRTIMRSFLFDHWHLLMLRGLTQVSDARMAGIAAKAVKEVAYHADRSAELVVGLGDGTEESHRRMQDALDRLWPYVGEMFIGDEVDAATAAEFGAPVPDMLRAPWDDAVLPILAQATLTVPDGAFAHQGGKTGARHTEHLGHMLTTMQWLHRAYPGANW
ncbi:phenylacetic acid degradation protein [Jannaschia pagri]|uniref:Phenylacetic acid degradation protein n=1 Tax=Jannaschia pagri TaxID=2829797 RepID=A0ABQ4NLS9_9RHOB|nr:MULTISPECIES: 1,2-phenylacetyl-CoA epoxidase subunit PaaC [unclassified Jannaschia]GIT91532.1 phenylacetic acid degradation protein [Jannaschia sp. AI_61]GIT95366.1 phenylacetic acid degradation protein [Jannaschia sp. AI_62]